MRPELLARAIELDDAYPDNVCPGCQHNIAGWQSYWAHYPPGARIARNRSDPPMPFIGSNNGVNSLTERCVWNLDYLAARQHRRRYIAEHQSEVQP